MHRPRLPAVAVLAVVISCGGASPTEPDADRPVVVATTSIIGGALSGAFGESLDLRVLIPGTADPHSYRASPDQAGLLREADLVVASGLGLEEALTDVLEAAAADGAAVIYMGDAVETLGPGALPAHEVETGGLDPHFWLDPMRMRTAIDAVAAALARVDPTRADEWQERASSYGLRLERLDGDIREMVGTVPVAQRRIITNHDSLGYFADAYGFEIIGTVFPGASTLAEPSASDLAELISILQNEDVPAIFAEATRPTRLAEVVASEAGREVAVVELYTGSLGDPGSGAETYAGYLMTNAELIVQALSG